MSNKLSTVKQLAIELSLQDKQQLLVWLENRVETEQQKIHAKPNREIVEQQQHGRIIYQLERIKCGKASCKCNRGELHGPYWYGYQRKQGKLKSWYIGKKLKLHEEP